MTDTANAPTMVSSEEECGSIIVPQHSNVTKRRRTLHAMGSPPSMGSTAEGSVQQTATPSSSRRRRILKAHRSSLPQRRARTAGC